MEVITTFKRKPALVMDGYRYRAHRRAEASVSWRCVNERKQKCRGSLKTTLDNQVIRASPHQCQPNFEQQEVQKAMYICKKRTEEDLHIPVPTIFREEFAKLAEKGLPIPNYANSKTMLCLSRRRALDAREQATCSAISETTPLTTSLPVGKEENPSIADTETSEVPSCAKRRKISSAEGTGPAEGAELAEGAGPAEDTGPAEVPPVVEFREVRRSTGTAQVSPVQVLTAPLEGRVMQINQVVQREDVGHSQKLEWDGLRSAFDDDLLLTSDHDLAEDEQADTMVKSGTGAQQYCLRWKYHHSNLQVMFIQLLQRESFCDVTLACEGKMLRAHKVVLSACSTYFDKIFSEHEEKDPVVILKDVKFVDIKALVEFMYKGEINVENSHLNSLLKTAEELKIKGLADVSGKGLPEDDDSITYAPAPPRADAASHRTDKADRLERERHERERQDRERHERERHERERHERERPRDKEEDYDGMFDSSLLENSVSINDGSDVEEGTSHKDYGHDDNEYNMESSNEHNFSTLISHLQDYRTAEDYSTLEREREREQREMAQAHRNPYENPILSQFSDVVKMNDYLTTGRRQQFWEEPFTRRLMEAIKNKEIEMKAAAELMGVSYGTLYGRYRDAYGCLKHPYRTKDFWAEQGPADILARLQKKEITLFRAAEMLNVTVTTLANYLATLRYEKQAGTGAADTGKSEHDDDEEMDVNDSMDVFLQDPVPSKPKTHKAGSVSITAEDEYSHSSGVRVATSDDEF